MPLNLTPKVGLRKVLMILEQSGEDSLTMGEGRTLILYSRGELGSKVAITAFHIADTPILHTAV